MRLLKYDKSSDMNGQRWLVVSVTHFSSGHGTLQRYILVVMVKSVKKNNSKCYTRILACVNLWIQDLKDFSLEIRIVQRSLVWEIFRFNLIQLDEFKFICENGVHAKMIFSKTSCLFIKLSLNELLLDFITEYFYRVNFSKMLVYEISR